MDSNPQYYKPFFSIIIVSIFSHSLIIRNSSATCPNANDIQPCNCNSEGLQCLRLNDTTFRRLFREIPNERKAIRRVWILQTNVTSIGIEAFGEYILRDLYMDLNKIKEIHLYAFGPARETLQTISLSRNLLTSFPFQCVQNMTKLRHLSLAHNLLSNISAESSAHSTTLESLDLSSNMISEIESSAFSRLHALTMLDLSKNRLKLLTKHSLLIHSINRNLMVSLRSNHIDTLGSDVFGFHHPLTLDLSRNKLTYLEEYFFAPLLTNNTLINVAENPFSCYGCTTYRWLLEFDVKYLDNLDNFACLNGDNLRDLTMVSIGC